MTPPPDPSDRPAGLSVRIKLTLSYAGFLVVAGLALFAVGFLLLRFVPEGNVQVVGGGFAPNRTNLLEVFVRYAWWAMGGLLVFGLVGGWLLAGRMLQPLARITDAARQARDGRLDHRVALPGPRDELTDLADTFDAMLDRIQQTLDEQRRFAANASHELRTPHAIIRTMVEVAQADPTGRDVDLLLHRIGVTNDRASAITEALLALSRAEQQSLRTSRVDLAELARNAVDDLARDAERLDVRIETALATAAITGDRILLAQLARNLVHNAIVHNSEGGAVWVSTAITAGGAMLTVTNSGVAIDPDIAATLTEPFVRGAGRTRAAADRHDGSGLGLAIVASVVRAHHGTLDVVARSEGGLAVEVRLPGTRAPIGAANSGTT
jgi:two-component system sensor histidine kinase VanS